MSTATTDMSVATLASGVGEPAPTNHAFGEAGSTQPRKSVDPARRGQVLLSVPGIHCGRCIAAIEDALNRRTDVAAARVNLTLKRVSITPTQSGTALTTNPAPIVKALADLGFDATPIDVGEPDSTSEARASADLLRAVAIAGFGATNIMLMSVAVWSGADGPTREAFHLLSAIVALPVVAYAGQPFFRSALAGLRAGRVGMDVPISIGVLLAVALSLFETARGGDHVFFDAAVTLLLFLLVGRYLDQLMRDRARSAVTGLARLAARSARVVRRDGGLDDVALNEVALGMVLRVAPGDRMPVDARILRGFTDLDRSLVTGESAPIPAGPGDAVEAGTLNVTGGLDVEALRPASESFLAEMMRMLAAAEQGRGPYLRIADRAARLYAPVVHTLALATFLCWMLATGGDWQRSIFVAISVLIITCPCALGLAVPVTQVVASGRLMREGILVKDGSALERLAEIDHVVFDKTGTLTTGTPRVAGTALGDTGGRAVAKALALHSSHPASRALASHLAEAPATLAMAREVPGHGVEGFASGRRARLGRAGWVAEIARNGEEALSAEGPAFAIEGQTSASFTLHETLRPGATAALHSLRRCGIGIEILSGDAEAAVGRVARELGVERYAYTVTPAGKVAHIEALRTAGCRVLMVGDGLNDTAALAAAHVSMAPGTASDAGRLAADVIFLRENLGAVAFAHEVARRTARLVRQNLGLAIAYNVLAIPLAVAGLVTPLVAALAMSASSILVVGNALRLSRLPARRLGFTPATPGSLTEAAA